MKRSKNHDIHDFVGLADDRSIFVLGSFKIPLQFLFPDKASPIKTIDRVQRFLKDKQSGRSTH
jgi:hypothetical protein